METSVEVIAAVYWELSFQGLWILKYGNLEKYARTSVQDSRTQVRGLLPCPVVQLLTTTYGLLRNTKPSNNAVMERIEQLGKQQAALRCRITSNPKFTDNEKAAMGNETMEDFKQYWAAVNTAASKFEDVHQRGCGLWARRYQETTASAQDFMERFSPIFDVVKDGTAPFGGIAVGTLSFLFAVSLRNHDLFRKLYS